MARQLGDTFKGRWRLFSLLLIVLIPRVLTDDEAKGTRVGSREQGHAEAVTEIVNLGAERVDLSPETGDFVFSIAEDLFEVAHIVYLSQFMPQQSSIAR